MCDTLLITGSTGIAAAVALQASALDISIVIAGIDTQSVRALASQCCAVGVVVDLQSECGVDKLFATHPEITQVIHVAGGSGRPFGDGALMDVSLPAWQATFKLNLDASFLVTRAAIKLWMEKSEKGSVVLTGSVLAEFPEPDHFAAAAYMSSKSALIGLVKHAASVYAEHGIRVNAVVPGLTRTPMSNRAQENEKICAFVKRRQPLTGGFIEPNQVADALLFLSSHRASAITGQLLNVDGGWSLGGKQYD